MHATSAVPTYSVYNIRTYDVGSHVNCCTPIIIIIMQLMYVSEVQWPSVSLNLGRLLCGACARSVGPVLSTLCHGLVVCLQVNLPRTDYPGDFAAMRVSLREALDLPLFKGVCVCTAHVRRVTVSGPAVHTVTSQSVVLQFTQ